MKSQESSKNRNGNAVSLLLLLGLIILRFPFWITVHYKIMFVSSGLVDFIFYGLTYFFTALLIFLKRGSLADYNMGFGAVMIFMAAPCTAILGEAATYKSIVRVQPDLWFRASVSICLFIALTIYHPKLRKKSISQIVFWSLAAVIVGICTGPFEGIILGFQTSVRISSHPTIGIILYSFFIQLGNAAAIEEPLFRGFLWGLLKKLHWHEWWIWLFQAALFWLGHIYYFGTLNYSFFILVPITALILGLIVWRSRSIGTSMIVHGLINSLGDVLAHYVLF